MNFTQVSVTITHYTFPNLKYRGMIASNTISTPGWVSATQLFKDSLLIPTVNPDSLFMQAPYENTCSMEPPILDVKVLLMSRLIEDTPQQ